MQLPKTLPITLDYDQQQIRIIDRDGEPWFVAIDLCKILGLSNATAATSSIPPQGKYLFQINTSNRGFQEVLLIDEGGMYELFSRSRKPIAQPLRTWMCREVLPAIRKYGCYPAPLITAGDRALVQVDSRELAREFGIVLRQTVNECTEHLATKEQVNELADDVHRLDDRISRIERRRNLTVDTQRTHLVVVHAMFSGKCPCCKIRYIVNPETGERTRHCQFDHWESPSKNAVHQTWAICMDCNQLLKTQEKQSLQIHFEAYQKTRLEYQRMLNPKLPGVTW